MQVTRQYHSLALLLPDGRVLSAGGGICGTCDAVGYLAKNAEIFSPPYLFQADGTPAPRPSIEGAPASTTYGGTMTIATSDPAAIRKVALVRLGAVTHSNNMEQRFIPLSYTAGATSLDARSPADANIAPPGIYMLFIIDANGVPSVARMVNVHGNSPPTVTLTQPTDGASFTAPATISLAATASDPDGIVSKVEFFDGVTKLGEDTTSPYSFTWSGVGPGSYTLTARVTEDLGATATSAPSRITVVNANVPPAVSLTFPADGASFPWKPTIAITATATDSDGTIAKVEFRDGTKILGQDTTAPYSFTWRNVAVGTHVLTARATDNGGRDDEQRRQHHRALQAVSDAQSREGLASRARNLGRVTATPSDPVLYPGRAARPLVPNPGVAVPIASFTSIRSRIRTLLRVEPVG
jgi:Galactose oxidase-like, Early set domain/Bacterial Ig domain